MIKLTFLTTTYHKEMEFETFNEYQSFLNRRIQQLKAAYASPTHDFAQFGLHPSDLALLPVWEHLSKVVRKGDPIRQAVVNNFYAKGLRYLGKSMHGLATYVRFEVVR